MKLLKYISHFVIGSVIPVLFGNYITTNILGFYNSNFQRYFISYIISIVPAIIYFKLIKTKWWYGLISPVVGALGIGIIFAIFILIYYSYHDAPGF